MEYRRGSQTVRAVDGVSLEIATGTIQGIVGFSGADKSTLLCTINLLERPTSGSSMVAGQELTALSKPQLRQTRHQIGVIFQHFNLVANLTALKNVELSLKFAGVPGREGRARALEALEIVDLADSGFAPFSEIGRLLRKHEIVLTDPTTGTRPELIYA